MRLLKGVTDDTAISASSEDQTPDNYRQYIEDHLKKNACPSFCSLLWYDVLCFIYIDVAKLH